MDIVLIPGFWLQASSWDEVAKPLRDAGHTVHALTLPGLESVDADRSGITLQDHVDAVVAAVDGIGHPVVLVGHSGGGSIAYAVADARPDSIARLIYVDSGPLPDGGLINDELPVVNGEVPLPDWSEFEEADLVDLTDELRSRFRAIAVPEPLRVTSDKFLLTNDRRRDVPATLICCEFTTEDLEGFIAKGWMPEVPTLRDAEYVDLPTGHWPQFTRPADLAATILAAIR